MQVGCQKCINGKSIRTVNPTFYVSMNLYWTTIERTAYVDNIIKFETVLVNKYNDLYNKYCDIKKYLKIPFIFT